jgi:membrane associated rhomboid family serine protease
MLFPWWLRKADFFQSPVTVVLMALSFFFLAALPPAFEDSYKIIESLMGSPSFIKVQSYEYQKYLSKYKPEDLQSFGEIWRGRAQSQDKVNMYWAQLSFRDSDFSEKLKDIEPYPDSVMYNKWLIAWDKFMVQQKLQWTTYFGLSILGHNWTHYITYQFIHSGLLHFFSNIVLLIFFGFAVEGLFGGKTVAIVYLCSGIGGAIYYEMINGINTAPLVGASASVSGLMAFYFLTESRKNLKFFYFFAPIDGFFGEIYLSKEWLVPLMFLNDINEVFSTPDWLLSVAHTAHLGAVGCGFVLALVWKLFRIEPKVSHFIITAHD